MSAPTNLMTLPMEEELTVEEIPLSAPALRTASYHMGKHCLHQSREFMLCDNELRDPRKCLKEGAALTACGMDFLRKLKKSCNDEFETHWRCIENKSSDLSPARCRNSQGVYDKCMLDNLGMERPYNGFYSRPHMHESARPQPPPPAPKIYTDVPRVLPPDYPKPPAKYGSRQYWFE
ncbi:PREDICTED: NADH dehydrogenase [ubiquinone] 1 alpha subcomplex subunit 8-like [Priapulus caudatus]|uniref:NADH dehydrogenase [ubiquinone] 1 alpha subcomplex subunit 8 n=1 Tax=Priapulus caudatus TaxID=37621 RepID=A0ABM1F887_PRICU|nr:PREDICTED: NADH dehydrogenase [ubiquinone] 1 alpha subcomplex subunit 8-like [Priapulus caudatus]